MSNRLAGNPSPYLEQHADNPVHWWPWCDEAFAEAKARDVPIFLSIGYATCHWCHVMAHDSFEDEAVASLMNEAFVCIKVDREERPDIDDTYMAVCQAMNGSGGWPLTVLLDHDKRAWFAGTFFPKQSGGHRMGMLDLVPALTKAWSEKRDEILHSAGHLLQSIQSPTPDPAEPPADGLELAARQLAARFDAECGGFGGAPKFPSPHQMTLLLRHYKATGEAQSLAMVSQTLDGIIAGGVHDHVGGGFHRYSTDKQWLLPHFEKMLYDQAGLLNALTLAWQVTQEPRYKAAAEGVVSYVLRDLRHPDGGFYSAEDADSEGEEGTFYIYDYDELVDLLGSATADALGARPDGNFNDEASRQPTGKNIIHVAPGKSTNEFGDAFARLLAHRSQRERPLRDEKILADWNGLWLTALTRAAMTFERGDWLDAATTGGAFLVREFDVAGRLRHRWRDGVVDEDSFLDDHSFVGLALVTLFEATGDASWLEPAQAVASGLERFVDGGAYLQAPKDGDFNLARRTDAYDGAMQSGNAGAVEFLWRLGRILGSTYEQQAWACCRAFGQQLKDHPMAFCAFWGAIWDLRNGQEIVTTGSQELLAKAWQTYAPSAVRINHNQSTGIAWIDSHPLDQAAAYVCKDHACAAPVNDAAALDALLG